MISQSSNVDKSAGIRKIPNQKNHKKTIEILSEHGENEILMLSEIE